MEQNDLQEVVFRLNLTYDEIEHITEENMLRAELKSFSASHYIYMKQENQSTLQRHSLPENMEIDIIASDIKLEPIRFRDTNRGELLKNCSKKLFFKLF